ncbi:hemerythrin domain-containing protein [bacterium]|nr:hemerythrin domain-containing protein [bacterium]
MENPSSNTRPATLGDFVRQRPQRLRLCEQFGLNVCVAGGLSVEEACIQARVDPEYFLSQCEALEQMHAASLGFMNYTPRQIACDILNNHHEFIFTELAAIERLLERVSTRHWQSAPVWPKVLMCFRDLRQLLEQHLINESPMIRELTEKRRDGFAAVVRGRGLRDMLVAFEGDHERVHKLLVRIRSIVGGYCVPRDACLGQQAVVARLRDLEQKVLLLIQKEDNLLFVHLRSGLDAG